jgi:colicin import membrane protein
VIGDRDGRDQTISASEASLLAGLMKRSVQRCWNINAGLDGIENMVVKVQVRLSRDGMLVGPPRVVNSNPSPLFRDAADSAVRALIQCAPYSLPPDKYDGGWEFMELRFDPRDMF